MKQYTLEQAIEHLMDEYGSFQNISIDKIKEDNNFYVIYFKFKILPVGLPASFKLNKITGELTAICLPNEENFKFLDYFANCKTIQIPSQFKNKWF